MSVYVKFLYLCSWRMSGGGCVCAKKWMYRWRVGRGGERVGVCVFACVCACVCGFTKGVWHTIILSFDLKSMRYVYGVVTVSKFDKIIGLFCKRAL